MKFHLNLIQQKIVTRVPYLRLKRIVPLSKGPTSLVWNHILLIWFCCEIESIQETHDFDNSIHSVWKRLLNIHCENVKVNFDNDMDVSLDLYMMTLKYPRNATCLGIQGAGLEFRNKFLSFRFSCIRSLLSLISRMKSYNHISSKHNFS